MHAPFIYLTRSQSFGSCTAPRHPNLICIIKALLAFGAAVNSLNKDDRTPLDIAYDADPESELVNILTALGGLNGEGATFYLFNLPQLVIVAEAAGGDGGGGASCAPSGEQGGTRRRFTVGEFKRYSRKPDESLVRGITFGKGEGYAAWKQFRKNRKKPVKPCVESNVTSEPSLASLSGPLVFQVKEGERVLCLDGGSMRGLIQIEILSYIEDVTQCRITELFDWIVGTSTGGVVALGLVYGKNHGVV